MGQRSWRCFYHVILENRLVGILLLTNMAAAKSSLKSFIDIKTFFATQSVNHAHCNTYKWKGKASDY